MSPASDRMRNGHWYFRDHTGSGRFAERRFRKNVAPDRHRYSNRTIHHNSDLSAERKPNHSKLF
jgi:hypothetical protein